MYDDHKRYENDGLYNEDTDYEDEYDADDSDYIVDDDDEDEDENALWDDAEEDTDEPPEKKRRKRKKKDLFADRTAILMLRMRKPRNMKRHGADLQRNSVSLMK